MSYSFAVSFAESSSGRSPEKKVNTHISRISGTFEGVAVDVISPQIQSFSPGTPNAASFLKMMNRPQPSHLQGMRGVPLTSIISQPLWQFRHPSFPQESENMWAGSPTQAHRTYGLHTSQLACSQSKMGHVLRKPDTCRAGRTVVGRY